MPPKFAEQSRRDKSPDNKHDKGRDDESKMDKLKDKMGGLMHSNKDDGKDKKHDGRQQDEKENKGRERSRSRERQGKNQSPDRMGKNQSPDRKGPGAGPGRHQQEPMMMGASGAGAGNKMGGHRGNSPERHQGPGHAQGQDQGPGHGPGQGQGHGQGPNAPGHHQGPGQGQGPNAQKPHTAPGAGVGAGAGAGAHAGAGQKSRTKRGLCWPVENKKDDPSRFTTPNSKVSWYYNWSPHPTKATDGDIQFIPMQWNAGGIKELHENVNRVDAKTMMAFNEPELQDQANMSADDAADAWMKHVEPLRKQGVRCGSPGISSAGHAVQWMLDFWGKIKRQGSDVDFWCFHWYGTDLGPFYDYIWSTHHQLDATKKVWITEFAATNWNKENPLPAEQVLNFAKESFKYLDSLDWVERYCWFAPTRDIGNVGRGARMYNDEGNLTELGKIFRDG